MKLKAIVLLVILFLTVSVKSQILISILFGDKLNSEKVEFGLNGGLNQSYLKGAPEAQPLNSFNLGFYFHFLLKNSSYISTGLQVKSNMGASGMPPYLMGNAAFDTLFKDGTVTTKINYFYLPVMYQHRFYKYVIVEAGFMAGLRTKVTETFLYEGFEGEVSFKQDIRNDYTHLDAGLFGGIGFKTSKHPKSMSIGVNFYQGLVDVYKSPDYKYINSSVYLYAKVPIGVVSKDEIPK